MCIVSYLYQDGRVSEFVHRPANDRGVNKGRGLAPSGGAPCSWRAASLSSQMAWSSGGYWKAETPYRGVHGLPKTVRGSDTGSR
jgi:hypothetical protein